MSNHKGGSRFEILQRWKGERASTPWGNPVVYFLSLVLV